ncbi:hypothetical protein C8R45DRAFT_1110203 [Mycena sanguinolenta]|nr:hypothetical protein C8R45DRAFT_1110203 [Mycena sanguinolenta]
MPACPARPHSCCVDNCRHRGRLARLFRAGRITSASTAALHPTSFPSLTHRRFDFTLPTHMVTDRGTTRYIDDNVDASSTISNYGSDSSSDPGSPPPLVSISSSEESLDLLDEGQSVCRVQTRSLVRAVDMCNPFGAFQAVMGDSSVISFLHCFMGPIASNAPRIREGDLLTVLVDGKIHFKLPVPYAYSLRHRVDLMCGVILAAGNDYPVWERGGGSSTPVTLPEIALLEARRVMPSILAFRQPGSTFENRLYPTEEAALAVGDDVDTVVNYHMLWTADVADTSIAHGFESHWNFARIVGMSRLEFYRRVGAHFQPNRFVALAAYTSNVEIRKEIDTICARLFSPIAEQIWVTTRGGDGINTFGDSRLSIGPVSRENSFPQRRPRWNTVMRFTKREDTGSMMGLVERLRIMGL